MIHQPQSSDGVHPSNQFVPETVSSFPCSSGLVRHILLLFVVVVVVVFIKEPIFFIGSLDKCHTKVFNAFIEYVNISSLFTK